MNKDNLRVQSMGQEKLIYHLVLIYYPSIGLYNTLIVILSLFTIYDIPYSIYYLYTISIVFPLGLANILLFHFPVPKAVLVSNYLPLPDNCLIHNKFFPTNNRLKKNYYCI